MALLAACLLWGSLALAEPEAPEFFGVYLVTQNDKLIELFSVNSQSCHYTSVGDGILGALKAMDKNSYYIIMSQPPIRLNEKNHKGFIIYGDYAINNLFINQYARAALYVPSDAVFVESDRRRALADNSYFETDRGWNLTSLVFQYKELKPKCYYIVFRRTSLFPEKNVLFFGIGLGGGTRWLFQYDVQYDAMTEADKLRKAAEQGDATAQKNLGIMYESGQGVPKDYAKAVEWFQKAAEQGNPHAQLNLGNMYYNGQGVSRDYVKAVEWYRKAAEQGEATAQFHFGLIYYNGQGVPQDYAKAVEWYQKAAEQGNATAQSNLSFMYASGQGVPQDYAKVVEWYQKAAERGWADAQRDLGFMYEHGRGVPQDYTKAVEWYRKAAEQGNATAQTNLGMMYQDGQGVPQDYTKAVEWYRKAAERGWADAQRDLGFMYEHGQGVPQDYTKAVEWYRKAAERGEVTVQLKLGHMYNNGQGVPQDYTKAVEWYRKAAERGEVTAQNYLGVAYANGQGVLQDYAKAMEWYQKAANNQNDINAFKALNGLAWLYATCEDGNFRNGPKAVEYALKATSDYGEISWAFFGTLAAAYARNDEFDKAIEAAQRSIKLLVEDATDATMENKERWLQEAKDRLELYRKHEPYANHPNKGDEVAAK
ncbi:MAG: SEL1-like repeat protein [Patescibacteria group bacterium]